MLMRAHLRGQSQIGWIFKSRANDSYCLYDSGPMVKAGLPGFLIFTDFYGLFTDILIFF